MTGGELRTAELDLSALWALWMACPAGELAAQVRADLAVYQLDGETTTAVVEFVCEYQRDGRGWSVRGLRGDDVIAPMVGVKEAVPDLFEFVHAKIASAEEKKWLGGSIDEKTVAAQRQYQRFAIVSTPRSGTHMLRTLLGSHPCIEIHGESFNRFGQHLLPYSVRDTTAVEVVNKHLFRPYFEYVEAVGFALFRDLDTEWAGENVWDVVAGVRDLRIIMLDRRSRLERLASLKKSLRDHVWYIGRADNTNRPQVKLTITRDELIDFIERDLENRAQFRERFGGHDVLQVEYEDLISTPGIVHDRLHSFLGISAATLQPGTGKKEKVPVSLVVDNIDVLRSELAGTKYEHYL
ncbi:hypothetical protein ABZZ74_52455 [Streptomyces sp. NPDC006476]|uniref:sulfotransferase n=1 Tax=Streptomyces sp. NPDC006476 TaxID=3157175 RepID=UPI0033AC3990